MICITSASEPTSALAIASSESQMLGGCTACICAFFLKPRELQGSVTCVFCCVGKLAEITKETFFRIAVGHFPVGEPAKQDHLEA